jgi:hypothetical protein
LRLAGVDIDAIADDYAQSGVQLAEMLARDRVTAMERGMNEAVVERIFTVRRDAMVLTMECVDGEHGGAGSLMRSFGLTVAQIHRLTTLMLSPVWP